MHWHLRKVLQETGTSPSHDRQKRFVQLKSKNQIALHARHPCFNIFKTYRNYWDNLGDEWISWWDHLKIERHLRERIQNSKKADSRTSQMLPFGFWEKLHRNESVRRRKASLSVDYGQQLWWSLETDKCNITF